MYPSIILYGYILKFNIDSERSGKITYLFKDIWGRPRSSNWILSCKSTAIQGPKDASNRLELDEFQVDKYRALSDI